MFCRMSVLFHMTLQLLKYQKHDSPPQDMKVGCVLATQPYGLPSIGTVYVAARMLLCLENWHLTKQYSEAFMAVFADLFCLPGKNGFIPKLGNCRFSNHLQELESLVNKTNLVHNLFLLYLSISTCFG